MSYLHQSAGTVQMLRVGLEQLGPVAANVARQLACVAEGGVEYHLTNL
jgi:hypothetical protein